MINDVRFALRSFLRAPGFTAVAVLTLALGIGATTAIFSVVNAVLLRPLPYDAADRLVVAHLSLPDFRDLERSARSFDGLAVWASNLYNLRADGEAGQVRGGTISPGLMPLLGVEPALGRNFTDEDNRQDVVILSYGLWQARYGGDPAVLGRTIELSGTSYTVVGVAPNWFRFPSSAFQLWTPIGIIEAKAPQQAGNRALRIFNAIARLKDGIAIEQAQAELTALSSQLARTYPDTNASVDITLEPLYERIVGETRPALLLLLATVGLLLLIACANVANLLLARASAREREMAIRAALGAGRGRLARQLVTESLVLALAGGALGLLVTMWGVDALRSALETRLPRTEALRVDAIVMLFALGATLTTALFFGVAPAVQTAVGEPGPLKGGRALAGTARGRRMRQAIVVAEIALALIVVVGAGLLVRSFLALTARDPGFHASNLLSFNVQMVTKPTDAARAETARLLIERLADLPGVSEVGASTGLPAVTPQRGTRFQIEGRTLSPDEDGALFIAATPGYFAALGTPVLRGRAIERIDVAGGQPVVVVNRRLAQQLFGDRDPVGRRIRILQPQYETEWRTIVGVVGDVQYQEPSAEIPPTVYTAFSQTPFLWLYVMVRPDGSADALRRSIGTAVSGVDPSLTAANVRLMTSLVGESVAEPRFSMLLVSAFAGLALALAAVGVYGVIAYSVARRTQEFGIRMALGARASNVIGMVLREALLIAAAGVVVGLTGAALLTRLMGTLLFGISPQDPVTFGTGAVLLVGVALLASYIPSRRALRADPIAALRTE